MAPSHHTCLGCGQDLKNDRSLANHVKACGDYKALLINKKKRQKDTIAKQKQKKKSRMSEPGPSNEPEQQLAAMDIDVDSSVSFA